MTFSHLDKSGNAKFVDISLKKDTPREAEAEAIVTMNEEKIREEMKKEKS